MEATIWKAVNETYPPSSGSQISRRSTVPGHRGGAPMEPKTDRIWWDVFPLEVVPLQTPFSRH
jgi:hypothetical protein